MKQTQTIEIDEDTISPTVGQHYLPDFKSIKTMTEQLLKKKTTIEEKLNEKVKK